MKRDHNVVHVSKIKKYIRPANESGPVSVVIDTDSNVKQEATKILDKKREGRRVYYPTLFEGDAESDAIWLPKTELKNCMDLVREYELDEDVEVQTKGECNRVTQIHKTQCELLENNRQVIAAN